MPEIFVGIGSNLDPERQIRAALVALGARFGELRISTTYRNPAVGFDGDDFLNLVVAFETTQAVGKVAAGLNDVETACGRDRGTERFTARTLDLDLLLYGDLVSERPGLCLPREEILDRAFVLKPLAELAGDRIHPVEHQTFRQLWEAFAGEARLTPVEI